MTFIAEGKPTFRVYDVERDLELQTGRSGGRVFDSCYFSKYSDPSVFLGGGFMWKVNTRPLTEAEKKEAQFAGYTQLSVIEVPELWWGEGPFELPGYTPQQTLEVILEAIVENVKMIGDTSRLKFETKVGEKMANQLAGLGQGK